MQKKSIRELLKGILHSPASASVFRGVLAYVLCFVLYFLSPFRDLTKVPSTGTSAILMSIAGFCGWTVGACLLSLSLGLLGIGVGTLNFLILAKLASAPVAQGFVFFFMVYVLGWIKAASPKCLIFSLLCILMTWNGVYTPFLTPNREFSADYLESYVQSYAWGSLISICVNVLVFPRSAESELRMTLVHSLDRIRTFFHLIEKTFSLEIAEDEVKVRDELAQTIRADFNILQAKLSQTFMGLSYSRWSVGDYVKMVDLTISMQQSLITAYSSLISVAKVDPQSFSDHFSPDGISDFGVLRKFVYVGLTEVQKELSVGPASASFNQKEVDLLKEIDLERDKLRQRRPILHPEAWNLSAHSLGRNSAERDAAARLRDVEHCIAIEVSDTSTIEELAPSAPPDKEDNDAGHRSPTTAVAPTPLTYQVTPASQTALPHSVQINSSIRRHWANFQNFQYDRVGQIFASDKLYHPTEPLIAEKLLGLVDLELRPARTFDSERPLSTLDSGNGRAHRTSALEPIVKPDGLLPIADTEHSGAPSEENATQVPAPYKVNIGLHHSLIRTYSHSFAIGMFLDELIKLREFITGPCSDGRPRRKQLHFHVFESIRLLVRNATSLRVSCWRTSPSGALSMCEALHTLEGRDYVPTRPSWLESVLELERALRSPDSICAFKGACALTVIAALFWCDATRDFALSYNINGAVLTVTVGLTSTLGQSWLSFIFQISGQSVGLVYAFCVLEIFRDVGGYKYNPYGLVCAMGLFAIPMCYVLYTNFQIFVMPLLALNSAGGLVYAEYLNQRRHFDSPALRMGKSLTTLAIALAIVSSFQLLILRNPAKRTLRKAMAQVMKANTAYTLILQSYVRSTIPIDPSHRAPPQAIERVAKDLMKQEIQIQNDITALMPLIKFAGIEPSFTKPFNAAEYVKIVRANQLILDRNRDARIAIGTGPLQEIILKEFVEKLSPYRREALARVKTSLYLCTSTLQSKFPLPEILAATAEDEKFASEIFHDALVLSSRLAHSPEGLALVKSPELTRYWLYLLSVTSVIYQLEAIQDSAKQLFGKMEDEPINQYAGKA